MSSQGKRKIITAAPSESDGGPPPPTTGVSKQLKPPPKTKGRLCSAPGCTKQVQQGGVCCKHGAKTTRASCRHPGGCTNVAKRGGLCRRHGAFDLETCLREGCKRVAKRGVYCDNHSPKAEGETEGEVGERGEASKSKDKKAKKSKKRVRKISICSSEGCFKRAKMGGVCGNHRGAGGVPTPDPSSVQSSDMLRDELTKLAVEGAARAERNPIHVGGNWSNRGVADARTTDGSAEGGARAERTPLYMGGDFSGDHAAADNQTADESSVRSSVSFLDELINETVEGVAQSEYGPFNFGGTPVPSPVRSSDSSRGGLANVTVAGGAGAPHGQLNFGEVRGNHSPDPSLVQSSDFSNDGFANVTAESRAHGQFNWGGICSDQSPNPSLAHSSDLSSDGFANQPFDGGGGGAPQGQFNFLCDYYEELYEQLPW